MALNLDVSKLTQSAAALATPHDNCIVIDLGAGDYPRDIEVRLPDDDGARQNALWDGSLDLEIGDAVLCLEYSGMSAWRVMGMGGNDGGAGKVRVSEVWESDFGDIAMRANDDGDIGIGTATIPHGAVGWAKFAIEGTDAFDPDSGEGGPHIQATTSGDDFPVRQDFNWTHDEVYINFDSYYDGGWKSSYSGSNFQLAKTGDRLRFKYKDGVAQGGAITWNEGIALRTTGRVGIGTVSPSAHLESVSSAVAQLRLSHTFVSKFADFTVDTNHHLTIDPSSTGEIKLSAAIVTILDDLVHEGDPDTTISFADDDVEISAGGLSMLKLTEAGQDLITLGPGSGDVDIDFNGDAFLRGSDGFFGIGTTSPDALFHVSGTGALAEFGDGTGSAQLVFNGATGFVRDLVFDSGGVPRWIFRVDSSAESGGDVGSDFGIISRTDAGGFKATTMIIKRSTGRMGIAANNPAGKLHVDQNSSSAAIPVLYLDQADVSEEMIEFASTIGTGNAIEAVGAKTLTTTHFIKVTLPGSLTRYIEVGTIA